VCGLSLRPPCIVCCLRKGVVFNWIVAAAVGLVAVVAVVDSLRSGRSPSAQPDASAPEPVRTIPPLSTEEEIQQIGNQWALLFAAGDEGSCTFMGQPLCERIACERVGAGKIENCTPPSAAFRRSFEDARVESVVVKGNRVAARFSNGRVIEFHGDGGRWAIVKIGGSAGRGFFE
jgi:hypothetical protein